MGGRREASSSPASISLFRPRRRRSTRWLVAAVLAAAVIAAGVVLVPKWLDGQARTLPQVAAVDGVTPLSDAQERFRGEFGRYAPSMTELETKGAEPFFPPSDLWFLTQSTADGGGFLAGTRGVDGSYAVIVVVEGTRSQGSGGTLDDALTAAGWTAEKLRDAGFSDRIERLNALGARTVRGGKVLSVITSPQTGESVASSLPIPRSGVGATWQAAVEDAGGDPSEWTVDFELSDVAQSARRADGSALTIAARGDVVDARIDVPGETGNPARSPEAAAESLRLADSFDSLTRSFRCATSSSENGVHWATLCEDAAGVAFVYATTGKGAEGSPGAFASIGADAEWAKRVGVTLPAFDDLL